MNALVASRVVAVFLAGLAAFAWPSAAQSPGGIAESTLLEPNQKATEMSTAELRDRKSVV